MGKANRERRRMKEKERKRARAASPPAAQEARREHWPQWPPPAAPSTQDRVLTLVHSAIEAYRYGNRPALSVAVARLIEHPDQGGWRATAERVITTHVQTTITSVWRGGWQPADLARCVGRQFGGQHVRMLADAVAAELAGYAAATIDSRWAAQLAELEAQIWWQPHQTFLRAWCERPNNDWPTVASRALELLCLLSSLPPMEKLGPIPGTAKPPTAAQARPGPPVDDRVLSRIRALLAKAEATTSEAEAEAFTAGAQERMARHSIDLAMLAATTPDTSQTPVGRRIGIDNPYEGAKATLLHSVARANRCRAVWSKEFGFCTVVGFEPDLDAVETLFTSLLVQATAAVTRAGRRTGAGGRSRTLAFRQSFLTAYAMRIGERLSEVTEAQTRSASAEPGGSNLLPVLATRGRAVQDAFTEMFPRVTQRSAASVTDAEGWHSGRGAADLATLHSGQALAE
jgi:hypothetical protein